MEYFYGGGGRSNPDFLYRFLVKEATNEMYKWCEAYPLTGPFERWYIHRTKSHGYNVGNPTADVPYLTIIQIENKKASFMFALAFSEYIIEDLTYDFAK